MPSYTLPGGTIKFESEKTNGRYQALVSSGGGGDPLSGFTADTDFSVTDNGDGTITITDAQSRFGTKPGGGKPLYVLDFAAGSDQPSSLGRNQVTINWKDSCGISQAITRGSASNAMIVDTDSVTGSGSNSSTGGDDVLAFDSQGSRKFQRILINYNDFTETEVNEKAPNGINWKLQRWQPEGIEQSTDPYLAVTIQANNYRFDFAGDSLSIYDSQLYKTSEWNTKRWRVEEERHIISSAAGATDANMYGYLDGKEKFARLNVDSHRGFDPTQKPWQHFKVSNFNEWAPSGECPFYWDLQYVDNSWAKVVITDQATWDESVEHTVEHQIPLSWASGDIDCHLRRHGISNLSGHYLWVVDDDYNKYRIGGWS